MKPKKCTFEVSELSFLGHVVGVNGIKVDPAKIQVVRDHAAPRNIHELRQFLGLTNYFKRFIQGYAAQVSPLQMLTEKDVSYV